jgi:amino acid permease
VSELFDRWLEAPRADLAITAGLVAVHALAAVLAGFPDPLAQLDEGARRAVYIQAAPTLGIIVAFATSAILYYYATITGRRLATIHKTIGERLRRNWIASLTIPLAAALGFLVLGVLDQEEAREGSQLLAWTWVAELFFLATALRLSRLVWLFSRVLGVAAEDLADEGPLEARVKGARRPRQQPKK